MSDMLAARLFEIGDFRAVKIPVPKPKKTELLIKIASCGVCGSDIPRLYELGTSTGKYPLTIGHEFAGTVVEVGCDADKPLIGKMGAVFPLIPCGKCSSCIGGNFAMCEHYDYLGSRSDGGFAEYCLIPSAWHFVESNNPKVSGEALSMTEPCTVAQHAIRKGGVTSGDNVIIFGAGPIGIMAARWAKLFGAENVMLCDVLDEKVEFGRARGADVINSRTQDPQKAIMERSGGRLADVIIEGTGTGAALGQATECARAFGKIVMMGNPHRDTTIKVSQHSKILRKELTLCGIWNSHYADTPLNEWTHTVKMLDTGRMTVEDLITHRAGVEELPALTRGIYDRSVSICKALCVPEQGGSVCR